MAVDKNGKPLPKGVSPRADGRYMGRFTYAGERYTLYDDDNPKRLKKAMDDMRYELEHGLYGSCKNITLDKWFDEYIKTYKEPILKESTVNHYRLYYRLYIQPDMGKKYIKDIKGIHVQKLYNELAKRGMKSNTIKKIANILHSTLKQAVRDDLLLKNPCEAADIPKTEQKERRVLTAKEQREFIDFVSDSAKWQRYYPLFIMAFGTGMRIGDADGKISLNQQKPSKHAGLRRFGPEKFLQRNNEFMKERPIFYKKPIKTEKDFSTWLRCFYYTTKAVITEYIYF